MKKGQIEELEDINYEIRTDLIGFLSPKLYTVCNKTFELVSTNNTKNWQEFAAKYTWLGFL